MSYYTGPWRRSTLTGLFWRTICFTGWHAVAVRLWLVGLIALEGAVMGFIIGLFVSFLGVAATAELPPLTILSLAVGAGTTVLLTKIGAGLGAIAGAILAYKASCPTCGVCIEMAFRRVLGRMIPVIPIIILARTVDCTVLIPPGCP
jgi:hypothetical protein